MPLAGHTPFHPRFSEHHRDVATGTHTAECVITRDDGTGSLDSNNIWQPPPIITIYTGPCRVTSQGGASPTVAGDQQVATRTYAVAIEWDAAEVLEHDIVTITSSVDPRLAGKKLRVADVQHASEQWERLLSCSDDLTRREA